MEVEDGGGGEFLEILFDIFRYLDFRYFIYLF